MFSMFFNTLLPTLSMDAERILEAARADVAEWCSRQHRFDRCERSSIHLVVLEKDEGPPRAESAAQTG